MWNVVEACLKWRCALSLVRTEEIFNQSTKRRWLTSCAGKRLGLGLVETLTDIIFRCNVTEKDNKCHWRKGRNVYDLNDSQDFSNWHCGNFDPTNTTTQKVTTTKKTTTLATRPPAEKRIPEGLRCRAPNGPPELSGQDGSNRIIGGVEAISNSWPWIVHLMINNSWSCGGVILSDKESSTKNYQDDQLRPRTPDCQKDIFLEPKRQSLQQRIVVTRLKMSKSGLVNTGRTVGTLARRYFGHPAFTCIQTMTRKHLNMTFAF